MIRRLICVHPHRCAVPSPVHRAVGRRVGHCCHAATWHECCRRWRAERARHDAAEWFRFMFHNAPGVSSFAGTARHVRGTKAWEERLLRNWSATGDSHTIAASAEQRLHALLARRRQRLHATGLGGGVARENFRLAAGATIIRRKGVAGDGHLQQPCIST